jgi:hypothetical protein
MFTPPVIVKKDIETDVQVFVNFLYRWSPEKRDLIIRSYPELTTAAQLGEEAGKEIVADFVYKQYRVYHDNIEILVADMMLQVQKDAARVLEALGEVMEYSWSKNDIGYTIIPTLLPFSPFQQPIFFFSLLHFLRTQTQSVVGAYGLTAVLAHEVSHFVFFDLLSRMSEETRAKCDDTINHLAKEILAPVVMNEPRLDNILHLVDYGGNPFLRHITIRQEMKEKNIVEFFREEYGRQHAEGIPFKSFISYLLETLFAIQPELKERNDLWKTRGAALLLDEKLKAQYCEPIEIKI